MTDRPHIRVDRSNTPRPRIRYDGPPELGTHISYVVDPPLIYMTGGGEALMALPEVCVGSVAVELLGDPHLLSVADGYGGEMFYGDFSGGGVSQPLTIPADTPIGATMLMCMAAFDLGAAYTFSQSVAYDGSFFDQEYRLMDVQRPWVPPGWDVVKFDVMDHGTGGLGLVMGVYSRVCQAGDPGKLVNPFGFDMVKPSLFTDPQPPPLEPADPTHPQNEGNWVAQLRTYPPLLSSIGRAKMAASDTAFDDPSPLGKTPLNGDPRGVDELAAIPAIYAPLVIPGAAHTVQFFALNGGDTTVVLPNGDVNAPTFPGVLKTHFFGQGGDENGLTGSPLLSVASEDIPNSGSHSNTATTNPSSDTTVSDALGEFEIDTTVTGGPTPLTAKSKATKFVKPTDANPTGEKVVRVHKHSATVGASLKQESEDDITELSVTSVGTILPGDRWAYGGETDTSGAAHGGVISPDDVGLTPPKVGPAGPLGPHVGWTTVSHWAGGALSDFTFPDQQDHGSIAAHPTMQVLDGSLTTADKTAVETYPVGALGTAPFNYHGEKYQAIWTAAGSHGDGSKLRAKFSTRYVDAGPQGLVVVAITLNTNDRRDGLACYSGVNNGWSRDLGLLATVQIDTEDSSPPPTDQNTTTLWQFPSVIPSLGNTPVLDTDGQPIAYAFGEQTVAPVPSAIWMEVWRDGSAIHAALWFNDPAEGAAPVWMEDYQGLGTSHALSKWGPSVPGYWGVVFDYLDPAGMTTNGEPMGLVELTLFQA